MTISEKIQHYRKSKKMSQEDLAKSLLVSRQTISLWENGQTLPTIDNLIRLRDIFGVSLDEMLCDNFKSPICDPEESFDEVYEEVTDKRRLSAIRSSIILRASSVIVLLFALLFSAVLYGFNNPSPTPCINLIIIAVASFALASIHLAIFFTHRDLKELKSKPGAMATLKINTEHVVLERVKDGECTDIERSKHQDVKLQKASKDLIKVCCDKSSAYLSKESIPEASPVFSLKSTVPILRCFSTITSIACLVLIMLFSVAFSYTKPLSKVERYIGISIPEYIGISESDITGMINGLYVNYSAEIFLTNEAATDFEKTIESDEVWKNVNESNISGLVIPDTCHYHGAEYFLYREYKDSSHVIVLYFKDENMMSVMLYNTP